MKCYISLQLPVSSVHFLSNYGNGVVVRRHPPNINFVSSDYCSLLGGTCQTIGSCFNLHKPTFCNTTFSCCGSVYLLRQLYEHGHNGGYGHRGHGGYGNRGHGGYGHSGHGGYGNRGHDYQGHGGYGHGTNHGHDGYGHQGHGGGHGPRDYGSQGHGHGGYGTANKHDFLGKYEYDWKK